MEATAPRASVVDNQARLPGAIGRKQWDRIVQSLDLSPQQGRIAALILEGKGDKQIASEMGVRFGTVRTYLSRAFERTRTSGRAELTALLVERMMTMRNQDEGG